MIIDSLIHLFIYFMLLSNLKKLSSIPYVTFKRSSSEIKTDEIFFLLFTYSTSLIDFISENVHPRDIQNKMEAYY